MSKLSLIKETAEQAMAAENDRTKHLFGRAEKLVAGVIIVTGFELLSAPNLLGTSSWRVEVLCYLALSTLGISLFFGFCGMRLKGYAGYPRGDKLWENLKSDEVSENAAEQALIQLLLKTREQNAKLNDAKANALSWCRWLLFIGFLMVAGSLLLASHVTINPGQL